MKTFETKLFIIFILNSKHPFSARFYFFRQPDFFANFCLTQMQNLRDYLVFRPHPNGIVLSINKDIQNYRSV